MLKWLYSMNCNMGLVNSNGHGALHKAAQRGRGSVCRWLVLTVFMGDAVSPVDDNSKLLLVGPDSDGCCPSDLAGMEGHLELAMWLAEHEVSLAQKLCSSTKLTRQMLPNWLLSEIQSSCCQVRGVDLNVWEPGGGVRRIKCGLDLL